MRENDPLARFDEWHEAWQQSGAADPAAAVLATADLAGRPSARLVDVLRTDGGFVFFTNYNSHKGMDLAANPHAALCFAWIEQERQVRVEGETARLSELESDAYFATLPRDVQLLSWASDQRRTLDDPEEPAERVDEVERRFAGQEMPRSPHWGGYRLHAREIELWEGRGDVSTQRLRYRRADDDGGWIFERLSP
jgi:pyridoxamine 5'-phosphate oxidase